jgi:hypothetical protein
MVDQASFVSQVVHCQKKAEGLGVFARLGGPHVELLGEVLLDGNALSKRETSVVDDRNGTEGEQAHSLELLLVLTVQTDVHELTACPEEDVTNGLGSARRVEIKEDKLRGSVGRHFLCGG